MEDRLLKFLDAEQLSSSKFADVIGVQRSSISHILSGRNKPSFDFLQKTLKSFPHLSAEWLILGKGRMYESSETYVSGSLFDQPVVKSTQESAASLNESSGEQNLPLPESNLSFKDGDASKIETSGEVKNYPDVSDDSTTAKKVERVILFYSDKSFISYNPGD